MSQNADNILLKHIDTAFRGAGRILKAFGTDRTKIKEIREHLLRLENRDLPDYFGAVLRDTIVARQVLEKESEESNPIFLILLFLAPRWLDQEDELVKPFSAADKAEYMSRYSTFSQIQISAIILWLEHVREWECCQYDIGYVDKALCFWKEM